MCCHTKLDLLESIQTKKGKLTFWKVYGKSENGKIQGWYRSINKILKQPKNLKGCYEEIHAWLTRKDLRQWMNGDFRNSKSYSLPNKPTDHIVVKVTCNPKNVVQAGTWDDTNLRQVVLNGFTINDTDWIRMGFKVRKRAKSPVYS